MELHAEITTGDILGSALANLAAREDTHTIVEIGTWSGMGSTLCIIMGIQRCGDFSKSFVTFEVNAARHAEAVENLREYAAKMPNLKLVHGSVIAAREMPAFSPKLMNRDWYDGDLRNMSAAPCRFDLVPPGIDLLFIDGGEYAGEVEFARLWRRSRIIVLDDTKTIKNRAARKHLMYDRRYRCLFDELDFRNGCCAFERSERKRHVLSNVPVACSEFVRTLRRTASRVAGR